MSPVWMYERWQHRTVRQLNTDTRDAINCAEYQLKYHFKVLLGSARLMMYVG